MTVHRHTTLPTGPATGRLLVAEQVLAPTRMALQASSSQHRSNEGLVFWLGRNIGSDTVVVAAAAPPTDHRRDGVFVAEQAVAAASAPPVPPASDSSPRFTATPAPKPATRPATTNSY